jgi:hypothetical protein
LEHRQKASKVFWKSAGTEGIFERRFRSQVRRKALKGESQECWGLRKASKGLGSWEAVERVAKP